MKSALIVVDVQNDFLTGGALAVADGEEVIPVVRGMMASAAFDFVVATQDWHPVDHGSFAANHHGAEVYTVVDLNGLEQTLWPTHCVQSISGAEFSDELDCAGFDAIFQKGTDSGIDSYSGFFDNGRRKSTGLADWLRERGVGMVTLVGLATDYCVKFTALDAVKEEFETTLNVAGCRGVNVAEGNVDAAIEEMRAAGVKIEDEQ